MSKKTTKKTTTEQTAEQGKAPAPATSAASTAATLGLCVLVTLPPAWKVEDPNAKPYWQIEIRDQQGLRYSDVYRVKQLEKARDLAEKIAKDRKLPIVTQEPPAPRKAQPAAEAEAAPMPDPEADAARCAAQGNCDGVRRAACSPHRTGTAIDIHVGHVAGMGVDSTDPLSRRHMAQGPAYRWLVANASRFGFTPYVFEPWHWEWTGDDTAAGGR